jgi:flavin-dependent dehydrogenase
MELGAEFRDGSPLTSLQQEDGLWRVNTSHGVIGSAEQIVAADGRNSTVARHLRMLSSHLRDDRVGLQTHIPHPVGYDGALEMHLYRHGYGGLADLGQGLGNLCLVSNPGAMRELRKEAEAHYQISSAIAWRSIIPISRPRARSVARNGVFLCGDSACVVEPFTGEGIAFALRTGALLARILSSQRETAPGDLERTYALAHQQIYRGKLGVNHLTRFLSRHPKTAHFLAPLIFRHPLLLSFMARKVIQ